MPIITVMPRRWRKEFVAGKMPASRITFCRGELGNRYNGFVIKASSKQMQMEYRYDIRGIRWVKPRKVTIKHYLSAHAINGPDQKIRLHCGYFTEYQRVGNVKQSCEYDNHANPVTVS